MMASNEDRVVPAGHDERRYSVFEVSEAKKGDGGYFGALHRQLDDGGLEAMLHDLLSLDLGDWHPRQVYRNAALSRQKVLNLDLKDQVRLALLSEGTLPLAGREHRVPSTDLRDIAIRLVPEARDRSYHWFADVWKSMGWRADDRRFKGFRLRPLQVLRAEWDAQYGAQDWPEPNTWMHEGGIGDEPF